MFDRDALIAACAAHGRVVRVVVARVHGSAPREVGAAMLVWDGGQSGTIGGGQLEFALAAGAQHITGDTVTRHALGPELGQCCGGVVEVLSEVYDSARAEGLPTDVIARGTGPMPLSVRRALSAARNQGRVPQIQFDAGWLIEPVLRQRAPLWIWGAGHVGRALVDVLQHAPDAALTWVDTDAGRFPDEIPRAVTQLVAARPDTALPYAPADAHHLILTYSHALDLALCNAALQHDFASCGLIGSATKWARFRTRLAALGHRPERIAQINCPIGDPALGKTPYAIAVGVAHDFAQRAAAIETKLRTAATGS